MYLDTQMKLTQIKLFYRFAEKTFESISIDFRRSGGTGEYSAYKRNLEEAAEKIFEKIDTMEPTVV